ncbi:uncharacterized protein B0I36DRAFT_348143 [Microdochium trichocladiopsis]|uniref:Uncharacterized protein n=1 Tax=Microdochium trichocladiopsis TaxID=1682393 RepID=A0A9P8Y8N9_9PEZI|nr:uncharacterized protein B0I36DRAFT_348143 [Microdochium trichocladiopsis]KAH7033018.1 hypothetical protein B0I36DRAFT_348143 [Microdochium trichocladiopsis]
MWWSLYGREALLGVLQPARRPNPNRPEVLARALEPQRVEHRRPLTLGMEHAATTLSCSHHSGRTAPILDSACARPNSRPSAILAGRTHWCAGGGVEDAVSSADTGTAMAYQRERSRCIP